ncbi:hypothetical protein GE061_016369 [Apolygus lucorum]|uniref:Peptidase S1 domain-containing protein n=1 Tax=Apolygus lucorum TaxID=248454 RepID=A0A8S9XFT9_APOLU|nr:hypothetical protein GE061_016369 [Apolygus lucorum]
MFIMYVLSLPFVFIVIQNCEVFDLQFFLCKIFYTYPNKKMLTMLFSGDLGILLLCVLPSIAATLNLDEGDVCLVKNEGNWTCVPIDSCRHANLRKTEIMTCKLRGRLPVVCCPPKTTRSDKSESACLRYRAGRRCPEKATTAKPKPKSGDEDLDLLIPLVIGGNASAPKSHPETVLLGTGPENDAYWVCGGSLISEKWVLSAAHCNSDRDPLRWVRLGDLDYTLETEDAKPIQRRIVRMVPHPQFKLPKIYHDVLLIEMNQTVVFNDYVAPICLHRTFEIPSPKATVVGWGRTGYADDVSSYLQEADISLVDHDECFRLFGTDAGVPRGIDKMAQICAGESDGSKDSCKGDSGSPLLVPEPGSCVDRLVGIVSTGKQCGLTNSPGVYTRVSTYVPWIESIVWP